MWDDDAGYDRSDPKHPDFASMWLDYADTARKAERENADTAEQPSEGEAA